MTYKIGRDGMIADAKRKPRRPLPLLVETNSEQQTFRDCRYKWLLSYERGLRPKVTIRAFAFGRAAHAGLEAGYRCVGTVPRDQLFATAVAAADRAVTASLSEWIASVEEHAAADFDIARFYEEAREVADTVRWIVGFWFRQYAADLARLVPIAIEAPFNVPMLDARGRVVPQLRQAGVWDLVAYDPDHGDVVLFDHKTTSSETTGLDIKAELDPQMAGYLYALAQELRHNPARFVPVIEAQLEHNPAAAEALSVITDPARRPVIGRIGYNVLRKKRPSQPKINKDGTVSVAAIDTLAEIYEAALAAQVAHWKPVKTEQAELLERLEAKGPAAYVSRREFWRTREEVERWRAGVVAQAGDMRAAMRDAKAAYRNPGHCSHAWSMPCAYRSICLDESPELMAHYIVQPRHVEVQAAVERVEAEESEA